MVKTYDVYWTEWLVSGHERFKRFERVLCSGFTKVLAPNLEKCRIRFKETFPNANIIKID